MISKLTNPRQDKINRGQWLDIARPAATGSGCDSLNISRDVPVRAEIAQLPHGIAGIDTFIDDFFVDVTDGY